MNDAQTKAWVAEADELARRATELFEIKKERALSRRERAELETVHRDARELREKLEANTPDYSRFDPRKAQWTAPIERDDKSNLLKRDESVADWVREHRSGYSGGLGADRLNDGSFGRVLRAAATGDRSTLNEAERRALGEGSGSGSFLVQPELASTVIDAARANSVLLASGAETYVMSAPVNYLARLDEGVTAEWHPEGDALSGSDQEWSRVELVAKTVVAGPLKLSVELAEDIESTEIDRVLRDDLGKQLGLALDLAAFESDGATGVFANAPEGIAYTNGVNVVTAGIGGMGAQPDSFNEIVEADFAVRAANGKPATACVMHPTIAREYALLADSLGQPLRRPESIASLPFLTTSQLRTDRAAGQTVGAPTDASWVYCGDFSTVVVGARPSLAVRFVQMNERYLGDNLQIGLIAWMRVAISLRRPSHLTIIKGLRTGS